jgi:hypothetical protein
MTSKRRPRRGWEGNFTADVKEMECESVWLRIRSSGGIFLNVVVSVLSGNRKGKNSFSINNILHGVIKTVHRLHSSATIPGTLHLLALPRS